MRNGDGRYRGLLSDDDGSGTLIYDDTGGDIGKQREIYRQWRMRWILDGMRWWSTSLEVPAGWDPRAQVRSIEDS